MSLTAEFPVFRRGAIRQGVDLASALIFAHRDWIAQNTAGVLLVQIRAFRNEKQLKVLDQPILSEGLVNTASNVTNILAEESAG